jgi:hypothetical protein
MKQRNPNWGCPRFAQQIALAFHNDLDKDVVRRILARHCVPGQDSDGPAAMGQTKFSVGTVGRDRRAQTCDNVRNYWTALVTSCMDKHRAN